MKPIDAGLLLDVGIALSKEKDDDLLFETILTAAMDITRCDGGTLYIKTDEALAFRTMATRSLGLRENGKNAPIALPPVPLLRTNVCARAALDGTLINVPDVYQSDGYDFSGPREYDALTGYRTVSMLVVPMENDFGDVIGVLQLINALGGAGEIVAFDPGYEPVILSLASQAAICLTNKNYAAEVERLLDSFVQVMSAAIDERSPYNANHTRNMVKYAEGFIDWLSETGNAWTFSPAERRQFLMSVWLHDIGKLVIPLEIMDKPSRLGSKLDRIEHRFETLGLRNRIALLEGKIGENEFERRARTLEEGLALIRQSDRAGFLPDETVEKIQALARSGWPGANGGGAMSGANGGGNDTTGSVSGDAGYGNGAGGDDGGNANDPGAGGGDDPGAIGGNGVNGGSAGGEDDANGGGAGGGNANGVRRGSGAGGPGGADGASRGDGVNGGGNGTGHGGNANDPGAADQGKILPLLSADELLCLSVRKGTLTAPERGVMESHVTMTGKMLNRMAFSKNYSRVPEWAASHHELLNGGGYPNQLAGGAIPREVRLLTILDIFDALTARDRPYKPAMPTEKALSILGEMARDGQLDAEILALFTACEPWLIRDELTRAGAQTREGELNRKEPVTRAEPLSRETPATREAPVSREEPMTREAPPARAETDG